MGPNQSHAQYPTQVEKLQIIADSYVILSFARPRGFEYKAGQHVVLYLKDSQGEFERTYSIASSPFQTSEIEFCIQFLGDLRASQLYKSLKLGHTLTISSARGTFEISNSKKPMIFVAGGSGISPLRSFIRELLHQRSSLKSKLPMITLVYGCRAESEIPFKDEFQELSKKGQIHLVLVAENATYPKLIKGNVLIPFQTHALKNTLLDKGADYYLCGPRSMLEALQTEFKNNGILESQVFTEKY